MCKYLRKLWTDERGAVVSIEMILIVTLAVLALVVGWSEVAHAINTELDDISNAIGHFNQSYFYSGFGSWKFFGGPKNMYQGSAFVDLPDDCDGNCSGYSSITCYGAGVGGGGYGGGGYGYIDQSVSHPGPAPIQSSGPCLAPDCVPSQITPGAGLVPVPDHSVPQCQPIGPQPAGPPAGPQPIPGVGAPQF